MIAMKKIVALLLALVMVFALAACSNNNPSGNNTQTPGDTNTDQPGISGSSEYKVAMITDYGDITDQSFNQTTWEAVQQFGSDNNVEVKYYKPTDNSTNGRVAQVELAVAEGYNVIVMPGYAFGGTIVDIAPEYPDVKFIALDVAKGDLLEAGVPAAGEEYDYNPDNWNLEDYVDLSNVYCAIYQEELCGYMAGYAAVKLGYTKLAFLGGMAVPAVMRYGYGFVQGADAAAAELGITVDLNYAYGNQFYGDPDIKAYVDTWYDTGTEIIFACGGGIYTSAVDSAKEHDGAKIIGVDVDQAGVIATYAAGEGDPADYMDMTVTSAMKGLAPTTIDTLTDVVINGNWANYVGKIDNLGLVSGSDPSVNYVQLGTTQYEDGKFTEADYNSLVSGMYSGSIKVSNDISAEPAVTNVNVSYQGNIK